LANPPLPPGDDASILDTAILWRRISPEWWVLDKATGSYRLSSAAFQNKKDTNAMSVGLADEIQGIAGFIGEFDGYGIAAFTAGLARQDCEQLVARAPEPQQPSWHTHVIGKKTSSVKKCLRDGCQMVVEPKH
jgi:hypothetical protein